MITMKHLHTLSALIFGFELDDHDREQQLEDVLDLYYEVRIAAEASAPRCDAADTAAPEPAAPAPAPKKRGGRPKKKADTAAPEPAAPAPAPKKRGGRPKKKADAAAPAEDMAALKKRVHERICGPDYKTAQISEASGLGIGTVCDAMEGYCLADSVWQKLAAGLEKLDRERAAAAVKEAV